MPTGPTAKMAVPRNCELFNSASNLQLAVVLDRKRDAGGTFRELSAPQGPVVVRRKPISFSCFPAFLILIS